MSCHGLVKCLMFFVNFIFSIIGIAIVAFGAYFIHYISAKVNEVYPELDNVNYAGAFIVIIGIIVFLISFTGCCGAIKEINCLLVMYIIAMIILAAVKIIVVIFILTSKTDVKNTANKFMNKLSVNDTEVIHTLEVAVKCCGTTGPNSYIDANMTIPITCCPIHSSGAPNCTKTSEDLYKGCKEVVPSTIDSYLSTTMYALSGVALFEILSMITAIYLTCTRKKGEYYDYD